MRTPLTWTSSHPSRTNIQSTNSFFFFSSRRRHTRYIGDWSSDGALPISRALGLRTGPVHAELRVNERGPWLVEIAGRSIGGRCSTVLEFGAGMTLEELILRHAVGLPLDSLDRPTDAAGAMMIPIPAA